MGEWFRSKPTWQSSLRVACTYRDLLHAVSPLSVSYFPLMNQHAPWGSVLVVDFVCLFCEEVCIVAARGAFGFWWAGMNRIIFA